MIEIVKHGDSTLSCECPECGSDVRETWDGHALSDEWKKYEKRRKERWGV